MNQLISIVIPVYNSQPYLPHCLDSIINQTYQNIEIVVVNDGSTDDSLNILEEYQKKDKRIKIINIKNCGVSHARNIGIKNSTGEYISFVDSDDTIEINAIEILYKDIIESEADLVQCNNYLNEYKIFHTYDSIKISSKKEVFRKFLAEKIFCTVWGKLYKRKLFNSVAFNEYYNNHEDELFIFDIIKNCEVVFLEKSHLYNYSWNKIGSLTNKVINKRDIELFMYLFNSIMDYTNKNYKSLFKEASQLITTKLNFLKEIKRDISINDFNLDDINVDVKKILLDFFQ